MINWSDNWAEMRAKFPVTSRSVYLNTAAAGPLAESTAKAGALYYEQMMNDGDVHWDTWLARCEEVYSAYLASGGRPSLAAWRARAALLGETVTVEEAGRKRHGTFVDIDDDGALLLQDAAGTMHRVVAGDLVRGPKRYALTPLPRHPAGTRPVGDRRGGTEP